jgi:hypothetical protein
MKVLAGMLIMMLSTAATAAEGRWPWVSLSPWPSVTPTFIAT